MTIQINGVATQVPAGAIAYKYADPTEDARWVYDESDVAAIRREDPSLLVMVATVNVYRNLGVWCYALFGADGYDHSDTLGLSDDATAQDALDEAAEQFPAATIVRVADTQIA